MSVPGEGVSPLGIYLLARSYHQAADAVLKDVKNRMPEPPARLLYLHAMETYLRCFLHSHGITPGDLRKFNHRLGDMLDEAVRLGLRIQPKTSNYLQSATDENDYVRARYDINVRSNSYPPPKGIRSTSLSAAQRAAVDLWTSVAPIFSEANIVVPE